MGASAKRSWWWLASFWLGGAVAFAEGGPFDPHGYLKEKARPEAPAQAARLTSRSVYKINGMRYFKYCSDEGEVYLPAPSGRAEIQDQALCEQHLRLIAEVLPMREGLPVGALTRSDERAILNLIRQCVRWAVESPVERELRPDGATVERRARAR